MPNNKFKKEIDLTEFLATPEEMLPETYQYYKNLKNRTIVFNRPFDESVVETFILPLLEMDRDGSNKEINIILNSPGGSALDGLVLCNVIDRLKTKTTITVLGYAYSMASILLFAGFHNDNVKKVCYPFSSALIHDGDSSITGSSNAVKDTQRFLERIDGRVKDYILKNSNITEQLYKEQEMHQWYMTSDEMLKYGLVDEIL